MSPFLGRVYDRGRGFTSHAWCSAPRALLCFQTVLNPQAPCSRQVPGLITRTIRPGTSVKTIPDVSTQAPCAIFTVRYAPYLLPPRTLHLAMRSHLCSALPTLVRLP